MSDLATKSRAAQRRSPLAGKGASARRHMFISWELYMSSIGPVQGQTPIQRIISNPIQKQVPANAAGASSLSPADKLELSGASGLLSLLQSNDIRAEKVTQIKAQIDAGTYESDQKLNVTVGKLLEDLSD
jgi:anti-sigma28 factor (negative regulator of flagellin synthesis)